MAKYFKYRNLTFLTLLLVVLAAVGITIAATASEGIFTAVNITPNPIKLGSSAYIEYTTSQNATISVYVQTETGTTVRTISENITKPAGPYTHIWDGKDDSGVLVPDGNYKIFLTATDTTGNNVGQVERIVTAARSPVISNVGDDKDPFNPALGEKVTINYNLSSDALVTAKVLSGSTPIRTIITNQPATGGSNTVVWDGKDDSGNIVGDGVYTYQIDAVSSLVSVFTSTGKSTVTIEKENPQITGLTANPNPFKIGSNNVNIGYTLSENAKVTINVLDNNGNIVQTVLNGVSKVAGYVTTIWNGKDSLGNYVPEGNYTIVINAIDNFNKSSIEQSVTITGGYQPALSNVNDAPDPFNPSNGEIASINFTTSKDALVTVNILKGTSIVRRLVTNELKPAGAYSLTWDGKDDTGALVGDATYTYQIDAVSPTVSLYKSTAKSTIVLDKEAPQITGITTNPDPLKLAANNLTILYTLSENAQVTANIVNSKGEIVQNLLSSTPKNAGNNAITWTGKDNLGNYVPEGIYTVVINAVDSLGKISLDYTKSFTAGYFPDITGVVVINSTFNPINNEAAVVNYNITRDALVNITILKGTTPVRKITSNELKLAGAYNFTWDGKDDAGNQVGDAVYTYQIDAVSPTVSTFKSINKASLTLEGRNPSATDISVMPATVKIGTNSTIKYTLSEAGTVNIQIVNASGQVVRTFPAVTKTMSGIYSQVWDTLDDSGNPVVSGKYTVKVDLVDNFNKTGSAQLSFDATAVPVIMNVVANPITIDITTNGQSTISYRVSERSMVTFKIYDANNVLWDTIYTMKDVASTDSVVWDGLSYSGKAVAGTYTYKIDAQSYVGAFKAQQVTGTINVTNTPSTVQTCTDCHTTYPLSHSYTNCNGCHGNDVPIQNCKSCHAGFPNHTDGSMLTTYQCEYCHNATYSYKIPVHSDNMVSHDNPTYTALPKDPDMNCALCHKSKISEEHRSHTDANGNLYTCDTCHKNTRQEVIDAIANHNKNCEACHIDPVTKQPTVHTQSGSPLHDSIYTLNPTFSCNPCHANNLKVEHVGKILSTTNTAMNCTTCHSSNARQEVIDAIALKDTRCDACHVLHGPQDATSVHDTTDVFAAQTDVNCASCHDRNVKVEHIDKGRVVNGAAMTCDNCHSSTDANVISAINTKNSRCDACHTMPPTKHQPIHATNVYTTDTTRTDAGTCVTCHKTTNLQTLHVGVVNSVTHVAMDCNTCHNSTDANVVNAISTKQTNSCEACHVLHAPKDATSVHNTTDVFAVTMDTDCATCHDRNVKVEHIDKGRVINGTAMTCDSCHASTNAIVTNAINTRNTRCDACHNMPPAKHNPTHTATVFTSDTTRTDLTTCSLCHVKSLPGQHVGKVTTGGATMDCNTCHSSTAAANVKAAISSKNDNCEACHTVHPVKSAVSSHNETTDYVAAAVKDVNCSNCHVRNIRTEHLDNSARTTSTGQAITCDTCHGSTVQAVKDAIAASDTQCTACHTYPTAKHQPVHNATVYTTDTTRSDAGTCVTCHKTTNLQTLHVGVVNSVTNTAMDCNTCHASTDIKVVNAISTKQTNSCEVCHIIHAPKDATSVHNTTDVFAGTIDIDCASCHDRNVKVEHVDKGRLSGGVAMTCDSCHASTNATVTNAINTNNTRCDACHTSRHTGITHGAGTAFVTDTRGYTCSDCHVRTISDQHVNKVTKAGTTMDCNTCHTSTRSDVQAAINNKIDTCDACHTIHGDKQIVHTSNFDSTFLISNCYGCHSQVLYTEHETRLNLTGKAVCDVCHNPVDTVNVSAATVNAAVASNSTDCDACHVNAGKHPEVTHGANTEFVPVAENPNNVNCLYCHTRQISDLHLGKLTTDGTYFTCSTCHDSTRQDVQTAITNKVDTCNACHSSIHPDLVTPHTSTYVVNQEVNCTQCHKSVISDEHVGKNGSDGQPMDCNTCHNFKSTPTVTSTAIITAIQDKNTKCDACHTSRHSNINTAHTSTFVTNPETDCSNCHNAVISTEHTSRNGANGHPMTCDTCHGATVSADIKAAVLANNTKCDACHTMPPANHQPEHQAKHSNTDWVCTSCHSFNLPAGTEADISTIHKNGCSTCHSNTTRNDVKKFVADHSNQINPSYNCEDCHAVHTFEVQPMLRTDACLQCHAGGYPGGGEHPIILMAQNTLKDNINIPGSGWFLTESSINSDASTLHTSHSTGRWAGTLCIECHKTPSCDTCHTSVSHDKHGTTGIPGISPTPQPSDCTTCHQALPNVVKVNPDNSPLCTNCHANHNVSSTKFSPDPQANCITCHATSADKTTGELEAIHRQAANKGKIANYSCNTCHNAKYNGTVIGDGNFDMMRNGQPIYCEACHTNAGQHPNATHGANTAFVADTKGYNCSDCHVRNISDQHVSKVTKAGVTMDCSTCHNSTRTDVQNAVNSKTNTCDACHTIHPDITTAHTSSFIASPEVDCSKCHNSVLNTEHLNRTDASGIAYTCDTCHKNTSVEVKNAITNKNTNCDACHTYPTSKHQPNHRVIDFTPDTTRPDAGTCVTCHTKDTLVQHVGVVKSGTQTAMTCDTCHASTDIKVMNAISTKQTNSCEACHIIHAPKDTTSIHNTTDVFAATMDTDCASCHDRNVKVEHVDKGRVVNGVAMTCDSCHASANAAVTNAISTNNTRCDACHTMPPAKHNPTHTATRFTLEPGRTDYATCRLCHVNSLTGEHVGKVSTGGATMDCNTCHNSSAAANVKAAISSKNDNCEACHTVHAVKSAVSNHNETTDYVAAAVKDVNCSNCHVRNIRTEHLDNPDRTTSTGQAITCDTCHGSDVQEVLNAIYASDTQCTACHTYPTAKHQPVHKATVYTTDTTRSDAGTCATCHKTTNLQTLHVGVVNSVTNTAMDCNTCHASTDIKVVNAISTKQTNSCEACHIIHAPKDATSVHNTTDVFSATMDTDCASCHDRNVKVEHIDKGRVVNGVAMTCDSCHASTNAAVTNAINTNNTRCDACHTMPPAKHNPTHTATVFTNDTTRTDLTTCSLCHVKSLPGQHVGKVTTGGVTMDCNTCHSSSAAANVKAAISSKNDNCEACHTVHAVKSAVSSHNETTDYVAAVVKDVNCSNCHVRNIRTEHLDNSARTTSSGGAITCDTCHGSTVQAVKDAIAASDTQCTACHTYPTAKHQPVHNSTVYTTDTTRSDAGTCVTCHKTTNLQTLHVGVVNSVTNTAMDCNTCHASTDIKVVNAISTKQTNSCEACHLIHAPKDVNALHTSTYVANPEVDCSKCHNAAINTEHTSRNGTNGQPMTCDTCHQSTTTAVVNAITTKNTSCDACHTTRHTSVTHGSGTAFVVNPSTNCADCHDRKLDTEHAKSTSTTSTGAAITCNTCHTSTNTAVAAAITNHDTKCDACHSSAGVGVYHPGNHGATSTSWVTGTPSSNCADCHNRGLDTEHSKSSSTTSTGAAITCTTCHKSTNTAVTTAITNHDTKCDACHSSTGVGVYHNTTHGSGTAYVANPSSNCADCHDRTLDTEHAKASSVTSTGAAITCTTCHNSTNATVTNAIATKNNQCDACHNATTGWTYHNTTHGSGTAFVANPSSNCADCHDRTLDTEHAKASSVTSTGAAITCTTCHKSTNATVTNAIATKNNQCDACHNSTGLGVYHPGNHGASNTTWVTSNPQNLTCSDCHSRGLDVEHSKSTSTTSTGAAITCNTCHKSTNTAVTTAISNKDNKCDACHSSTGVGVYHPGNHGASDATYMTNPPSNCADCHVRALDTLHVGNVTKAGTTLTCNTCHNAVDTPTVTAAKINAAITAKNTRCDACHTNPGSHPNANHVTTSFTSDTSTAGACAKCHKTDISVEHSSSSDKKSTSGAVMNCNTCHQSTNTLVKNAISTNNTACTACHATGGSPVPHSGVADPHKKTYFRETTTRCFTCHTASGIGFALTTNTNSAYHKIKEGTSYYPTISGVTMSDTSTSTDGAGYWVTATPAWTKSSNLSCKGCHDTSDGTATGTTYGKLLKASYSTNTGKSSTYNNDLCFKCHNVTYYTSQGSSSNYTNTGFKTSSTNVHISRHGSYGCQTCHSTKPHSQSTRKHFIAIQGEATSAYNSTTFKYGVRAYTHTTSAYSKSNCSVTCNGSTSH